MAAQSGISVTPLEPDGFKGGLSAENYIRITSISRAIATRDLSEIVELGALKKSGKLRHTRYYLPIAENLDVQTRLDL